MSNRCATRVGVVNGAPRADLHRPVPTPVDSVVRSGQPQRVTMSLEKARVIAAVRRCVAFMPVDGLEDGSCT
jgi:hypothetical protein